MRIDNERDRLTLPTTSWWIGLSRQDHRAAVEREAERMRQSRNGGSNHEIGSQPPTLALSARRLEQAHKTGARHD